MNVGTYIAYPVLMVRGASLTQYLHLAGVLASGPLRSSRLPTLLWVLFASTSAKSPLHRKGLLEF